MTSAQPERLDAALVSRGLVRSRAQAKEMLLAGAVTVDGTTVTKGSIKIGADHHVDVTAEVDHYVGRAAHKLLAALQAFPGVAEVVDGADAIDVGASTGGFTQVLLEHGARSVVALDVGHGQLAVPLRSDPRVLDLEGFNVRDIIGPSQLAGQPFALVVSDLSFISLTVALPHMAFLLAPTGHMVVLVKPQFEVGRERLGRSGIVSSREQRRESIGRVVESAASCGLRAQALAWSPMVGSQGNHEYLLWLRSASMGDGMSEAEMRERIEELTRKDAP